MNDDLLFIADISAHDSAPAESLVRQHQDRLYNTILHIVGSAEAAREVVQEAFVEALASLKTIRDGGFFICLNRTALLIAAARHDESHGPTESALALTTAHDLESQLSLNQQQRTQAALAMLSKEDRTVLVLREIDGCNYETIGKILDLPVGTVRSRAHRARMELRKLLHSTPILNLWPKDEP